MGYRSVFGRHPRGSALAGLLLLAATAVAEANRPALELAGVRLAPTLGEEPALPLRGAGLLRVGLFFDVYVAALYADREPPAAALLDDDRPKELVIHYLRDLDRGQIIAAAERHFEENLSEAQRRRLAPGLRRWHAAMRSVRAGDRYAMRYADDRLSLRLNDRLLIELDDPHLARAYFGIWLGEDTAAPRLRRALLALSD